MRRSVFVLACLLWSGPASAQAWTGIGATFGYDAAAAGTLTGSSLTVTAGQVLVVCAFNYSGQTINGIADGTNGSWTALTPRANGTAVTRMFYVVSAAGTLAPTVSYGSGATTGRGLYGGQYTVTGTAAFETGTDVGGVGFSGTPSTGTITATGSSNLLLVACEINESGNALSAPMFPGSGTASGAFDNGGQQILFLGENFSSVSGAITGTVTLANWAMVGAVFTATAGGGTVRPSSMSQLGAGR